MSDPSAQKDKIAMAPPRSEWLFYAIASGGCAALNGVFAKLTTTQLTSTWASTLSHLVGLKEDSAIFETCVRGFFFACNILFNAIMWGLFTRALTLASSTVRVSVINTSANFMLTALMGLAIFQETLPPLWWLGASFLVAGSVIIGRREESKFALPDATQASGAAEAQEDAYMDEPDAPIASAPSANTNIELQPSGRIRSRSRERRTTADME